MAGIGSVFHFTRKLEADSIYWNKIIHQYPTTLCLELEKSIRIFHKAFLLTPTAGIKPRPPEQQASALSLLHGADPVASSLEIKIHLLIQPSFHLDYVLPSNMEPNFRNQMSQYLATKIKLIQSVLDTQYIGFFNHKYPSVYKVI